MSSHPTDAEKIRLLPWSIAHNAANSLFSSFTFFGPVFILFLDALDLPKTRIGLLLSLLPLSGTVALFVAPAVSRAGVKRIFLACWTLRKLSTALLLLTPWALSRWGAEAAFLYVAALVALFAALRAVGETAFYPWFQEMVPPAIRGQYTGINNLVGLLASCLALGISAHVLDRDAGLDRFLLLIGAGVFCGLGSVVLALPIPGGAPHRERRVAHWPAMRNALRDGTFRVYLGATGLVTVALHTVLLTFAPLFLKEEVGLADGQILRLQMATYAAGLLSGYAWGRAADRRGGRGIALLVLWLMLLLPLAWGLIPRHHPWSFAAALGVALLTGALTIGWTVGDQRLLYAEVVPPERRIEYMALYYAWIGLVGGCGPLLAGRTLDYFQENGGQPQALHLDPYAPLFLASLLLMASALPVLRRLPAPGPAPAPSLAALRSASRRSATGPAK